MNNLADVFQNMIVCNTEVDSTGEFTNPCGYEDLIQLVSAVMNNLTVLATFLATISLIYIGFTLLTAQGDTGKISKAKDVAWKVVWGFVWVLGAWIVIHTLTSLLLREGFSSLI